MKKISKYGVSIVLLLLVIYAVLSMRNIANSTRIKLSSLNAEQYKIVDTFNQQEPGSLRLRHNSLHKEKPEIIVDYSDGFYIKDSDVVLKLNNTLVSFSIKDTHTIDTSTTSSSAVIDDSINISLVDKDKVEYDVSAVLSDLSDNLHIVSQKQIGNIGIIASMQTSEETITEDRLMLQSIIDSAAAPYDKTFKLFDMELNNISDMLINKETIILTDREGNNTYIFPSNIECIKAGLNKELKVGDIKFNYGDFVDKETNCSIYVATINKKQYKFLCTSKEILINIFSTQES